MLDGDFPIKNPDRKIRSNVRKVCPKTKRACHEHLSPYAVAKNPGAVNLGLSYEPHKNCAVQKRGYYLLARRYRQ